jgi:hypothetical protein
MKTLLISLICLLVYQSSALAWGERGHHTICEVATKLVKNPDLKKFLSNRSELMGHLCNVPDIYWRNLPNGEGASGDETHFLDPETAGVSIVDVPTDINAYYDLLKSGETNQQKADKLGSNWWRVEQFFDLSKAAATAASSATLPDPKHSQDMTFAYNKAVYDFMVYAGLMGHFVGDSTQPYHNSADYDGWGTGHGGIHSFYETDCVGFYDMSLSAEVEASASKEDVQNVAVLERMKTLGSFSPAEKLQVEQLDKTVTPSKISQDSNGDVHKVYAVRLGLSEACPSFRPLIVKELGRASANLAAFWDEIFVAGNSPNLSGYKSYIYPLTPAFVAPDYLK